MRFSKPLTSCGSVIYKTRMYSLSYCIKKKKKERRKKRRRKRRGKRRRTIKKRKKKRSGRIGILC